MRGQVRLTSQRTCLHKFVQSTNLSGQRTCVLNELVQSTNLFSQVRSSVKNLRKLQIEETFVNI